MAVGLIYPLAAGALGLMSWHAHKARSPSAHGDGELKREHQVVFELALAKLKNPESLRKLAGAYDHHGYHDHAETLRKRAKMRELPRPEKLSRRQAFRKGIHSKDKRLVIVLADEFDRAGAAGAAEALRRYADGLSEGVPKHAEHSHAGAHHEENAAAVHGDEIG